jgi:hypothetical protein
VDVKRLLYNFMMGTYPEAIKPTDQPNRFTMRVSGTSKTRRKQLDKRAMKEALAYAAANGYSDAKIVACEEKPLKINDYTIEFTR